MKSNDNIKKLYKQLVYAPTRFFRLARAVLVTDMTRALLVPLAQRKRPLRQLVARQQSNQISMRKPDQAIAQPSCNCAFTTHPSMQQ